MDNLPGNKESTYLSFRIEDELFAIDAGNVIEVISNEGVTPVPKTADYVEGIINFRGDILSVACARKKLNLPDRKEALKKVIIVIEFETDGRVSRLGMIVDKVMGVLIIKENTIQSVMDFGNYYNPEFLKGALKINNDIVTILNIEKIFSEDEVTVINPVKEAAKKKIRSGKI
jgi:purine-binding chemotaxis protein CheW